MQAISARMRVMLAGRDSLQRSARLFSAIARQGRFHL